jgi:acyl-CoA dehydrogenase family protein 9
MLPDGFLEKIHGGSLDSQRFHSFGAVTDCEKIDRLLQAFRHLLEEYPPSSLELAGKVPPEMLKKMGEMGLFGLSIPEAYGGLDLNLWEYLNVVAEMASLGFSVALVSLAHLSIGVKGIVLFGNQDQKQQYLVPAASGDMIFAYALTEPRFGSDAQHIETRAELSGDESHFVLNGQKTYITNANYAGGLTVFAQMDPRQPGFMGAFIVETQWEGVKIGKDMPKMGLKASSTASIQLKNVRVPRENLLGAPGDGFKIAMAILNYGRMGLGAASVGMMNQSVKDMLKRSSDRTQFGAPISQFPLIQEKIVKARVHGFVSACMNDFTAGLLSENPVSGVAMESSHCKLFGTTRAWDVLYDALQVAGGSGYIATQPYEKRMRDFRVATVFEGTTEIHSIYPPLFVMRQINKRMDALGGGKMKRISFLLKMLFTRTQWPLKFNNKGMQKASRFAKSNARAIKRMLALGMLLYGKKVSEKELLLRRITTLSLYLFGTLSVLAKIAAERKAGTVNKQEIDLLDYFVEEGKAVSRTNRRLRDSRKENMTKRVFSDLLAGFKAGK